MTITVIAFIRGRIAIISTGIIELWYYAVGSVNYNDGGGNGDDKKILQ